MRTHHTANAERNRARLISTPHGGAMSTTVAGVRFSDQLAALLDHAAATEGWRVETDTRGGKRGGAAPGVVVYPADTSHKPITVTERGAKFNKPHYENLRREMYRAGLPPLPADAPAKVVLAGSLEEAEAKAPPGHSTYQLPRTPETEALFPEDADDSPEAAAEATDRMTQHLADPANQAPFIGSIVASLLTTAGYEEAELRLATSVLTNLIEWLAASSRPSIQTMFSEELDQAIREARRELERDLNEALRMAEHNEGTARRAEAALERAQAKEQKARDDCGAALARAEAAEAKVRELEAAINPLRALLGKVES